MYILVHHRITNPDRFWTTVQDATPSIPPELTLHLTIPARDGSVATCLWEAASVAEVQGFVEPALGQVSRNEYYEAENREGVALPTMLLA
jgi:hypothetical protein